MIYRFPCSPMFVCLMITSLVSAQEPVPLTLTDAVGMALQHNFAVRAVRFDENASKMEKREVLSSYLPQIFFDSEMSKIESDRFSTPLRSAGLAGDTYQNRLQITQLLFDFTTISNIHLASLREEAAGWQKEGQEQQAVFETVSAYLEILRGQRLLEVQQQRLALAEKQLQTARNRHEAGYVTRTDVARAELAKSAAMRDINLAEAELDRAQVALNQAMGTRVDQRHELDERYLNFYIPSDDNLEELQNRDNLFGIANDYNPAIQIAKILVRQFETHLNITQGEFLPRINAGGSWGYYDSGNLQLETEEWTFQVVARVPIFEGGRKIAKIKRTQDQLKAETMRYNSTVQRIQAQIEETALILQQEKENLIISLQAEVVAKQNSEDYLNLYDEGLAASLEVTQAITDLIIAQTDQIFAQFRYLRVYVNLLSSLGRLPTHTNAFITPEWLNIPTVNVSRKN